jgi:dipeptidyl aminopeptidase/acylaminoacyl peptidase
MTCSGAEAMASARAAYEASVTYDESGEPVALMQPPPLPAEATPGLCVVNAVTGDVTRLPAHGGSAAFSPDGSRLAFTMETDEPSASEPIAAEAPAPGEAAAFDDGSADPTELTNAVTLQQPRNIAQGTAVLNRELETRMYDEKKRQAAAAGAGGLLLSGSGDVYLIGVDGSGLTRLTSGGRAARAAWSADGSRILYVAAAENGAEVWSVSPGGGTPEKAFTVPVEGWDASAVAVSDDGRRVVFASRVQANEGMARLMTGESPLDLHLLEAGADAPRRLENKHLFKQRFALSPDGRRVVYEYRNDKTGKSELWLLKL